MSLMKNQILFVEFMESIGFIRDDYWMGCISFCKVIKNIKIWTSIQDTKKIVIKSLSEKPNVIQDWNRIDIFVTDKTWIESDFYIVLEYILNNYAYIRQTIYNTGTIEFEHNPNRSEFTIQLNYPHLHYCYSAKITKNNGLVYNPR